MRRIHFSLALPKWHEWLVYLSIGLLTFTGLAWLLLDRFGKVDGEFGPEPNPALPWLLSGHGALAYIFLIVAAMLVPVHIRLGWNAVRNRTSGLSLVAVGLFLALTGLLLYYASAEGLRGIASIAHWAVGIALPLILAVHAIRGKASGKARANRN
jgi:hypothetical protein